MPKPPFKQVDLTSTERLPLVGARPLGKVNPQERLSVSVLVRPRKRLPSRQPAFQQLLTAPVPERSYLSREELCARHGAAPAELDRIEAFAHEHELTVVQRSEAQRRVVLSGTLEALTRVFGVCLRRVGSQGREQPRLRLIWMRCGFMQFGKYSG